MKTIHKRATKTILFIALGLSISFIAAFSLGILAVVKMISGSISTDDGWNIGEPELNAD